MLRSFLMYEVEDEEVFNYRQGKMVGTLVQNAEFRSPVSRDLVEVDGNIWEVRHAVVGEKETVLIVKWRDTKDDGGLARKQDPRTSPK